MTQSDTDPARRRWEERSDWPLTLAAVLFLVAYAWPILEPGLWSGLLHACRVVTVTAWLVFAGDYLVRVLLSQDRWGFVRRHVLDLLVVVLPVFRPLQLLRLVTLLNVLNRHAGASLRGRVAAYVATASTIVVLVSALAVLDAERQAPGGRIHGFGAALWWSVTTVTTVGYGDLYPVTATGRCVAVALMLAGIALLGVVTASLASWLIDRVAEVEEESRAATQRDVQALSSEIVALRREVERLRS